MDNSMSLFMMIIEAGVGIYFIFYSIVGKGKAYELESILPEKKEEYIKKSRVWYAILGGMALIMAIMDALMMFAGADFLRIPYMVFLVLIVIATFIGYRATKNCVNRNAQGF